MDDPTTREVSMNDGAPRLLPLLNVRNGAAAVAFY
jgi:hypothetical protein